MPTPKATLDIKESFFSDYPPSKPNGLAPMEASGGLQPHYSGNASQAFWDVVNACENCHEPGGLYEWGVRLQNVEEAALRVISGSVNGVSPNQAPQPSPGGLPTIAGDNG